jgi:DNA-binding transcriptional LysR family regulator
VPKIFTECEAVEAYALDEECIRTKGYWSDACPSVPLSAFRTVPYVLLTPNNDTRIRADKMCKEAGFRPTVALEVHQQATAYMIATTNMGATFISDTLIEKMPSHENMTYYKIDSEAAQRQVYFYFKRHKYKSRAVEEFMKFLTVK